MTDENEDGHLLYMCHRAAGTKAGWIPLPMWDSLSPWQQHVWTNTAHMFRSGEVQEPPPPVPGVFQAPEPLNRAGPKIVDWPTTLPTQPEPEPDPNTDAGIKPSAFASQPVRPQGMEPDPPTLKWG
jgi:hypothetical protein